MTFLFSGVSSRDSTFSSEFCDDNHCHHAWLYTSGPTKVNFNKLWARGDIAVIYQRRSKDTDCNESSPQPDETPSTDRIYNNEIMFTANDDSSNNGNVSIGQSHGTTYVNATFDQSEETMSNGPYPYATSGDVITGQSEETVDDTIYTDVQDAWVETTHHGGNVPADSSASFQQQGTSNGVYVNIPPAPSSGDYQELRPAVYQSLQKY
ncbi:biological adhesion [Branchiostoma belcheri]|nr:biological adhesion [Branchiostoma belcheri]